MFYLASDLKTQQTVWISDGKVYNPLEVCLEYAKKFASDVKNRI